MSLKKKSKSLGHLTGIGAVSPNRVFNKDERMLQHGFVKSDDRRNKEENMQVSRTPTLPERSISAAAIKATTPKRLKGLVRQKTTNSMSNPVALGKAFLARANSSFLQASSPSVANGRSSQSSPSPFTDVFGVKDSNCLIPNRNRAFLMDAQVKYTVGLQSQERNLFLFNDLLLVAKERSVSHFKLKDQIPLSDIWLSLSCIVDVSDLTLDDSKSLVIGWPITNVVLTFASTAQRNLWWEKLSSLIRQERARTPQTTNIQISYFDQSTNFEHVKSLVTTAEETAQDCICNSFKALDIGDSSFSASDYQLWVRTKSDEAPYPLIGHEIPFVIKLNWSRQVFNRGGNLGKDSYEDYKLGNRCTFILRRIGQMAVLETNATSSSQKTKLKKVKSSIKLQNVFRRTSKAELKDESASKKKRSASLSAISSKGRLFGMPLNSVCVSDSKLPKPVEAMLEHIFREGPTTVGIFRRSPNARAMRELREKLDSSDSNQNDVDFNTCSVFVTAALLKDFLRSLPDCLLLCQNYQAWIDLVKTDVDNSKLARLVDNLPRANRLLLHHLIHLLTVIAKQSQENMMTSSNLAICVGPSVLWSAEESLAMNAQNSKSVSTVMQGLIENYVTVFGSHEPYLFSKSESGNTDAKNKVIGGQQHTFIKGPNAGKSHNSHGVVKKLFDNSSLDSLLDGGNIDSNIGNRGAISTSSPRGQVSVSTSEGGLSFTNLSQDSGLTTSDSQLYAIEGDSHEGVENAEVYQMTSPKRDLQTPLGIQHSRLRRQQLQSNHRERMHRRMMVAQGYSDKPMAPIHVDPIQAFRMKDAASKLFLSSNNRSFTLRRTASEESVLHQNARVNCNEYDAEDNLGLKELPIGSASAKPPRRNISMASILSKNKGRPSKSDNSASIVRSNSVNHVRGFVPRDPASDWLLSRSMAGINNSSSCSTDSDDNDEFSTPMTRPTYSQEPQYHDGSYDIYLRDDHLNQRRLARTLTPTVATSSPVCDNPPGYEETISRQRYLKHYNRSNSFVMSPSPSPSSNQVRLVFDESDMTHTHPPPLPPKTERPPLPPKQRTRHANEETYANSEELKSQKFGPFDGAEPRSQIYQTSYSGAAKIQISGERTGSAPQLPPKDEYGRIPDKRSRKSITKIVNTSTQTKTMRNAETQTDETDFYLMYLDEDGNWQEEDEEPEADQAGFIHLKEESRSISPSYNRDHHPPDLLRSTEKVSSRYPLQNQRSFPSTTASSTEATTPKRTIVELRQAGRRHLEPMQSVPLLKPDLSANKKKSEPTTSANVDPIIQGEINWSVSQLRTLFNQGQQSPGEASLTSSSNSSNHNPSNYSNHKFTNGEYIESQSPIKTSKVYTVMGRDRSNSAHQHLDQAYYNRPHRHLEREQPGKDTDSDQESYV